jgi:DNA-binding PadR family transcriptional regulator
VFDSPCHILYIVENIFYQLSRGNRLNLNKEVLMSKRDHLGEFEQLVLLAILRTHGDAYGMMIRREIEKRTGRNTSIGAVYLTLERMEQKGLVTSDLGEATPERGGRAKRFFTINPSGQQALKESLNAVRKMAEGHFPVVEVV